METTRKMCADCPFADGNRFSSYREGWVNTLDNEVFTGERTFPHPCNMKGDGYETNDPELVCVGHLTHMLSVSRNRKP